jgi:cell division protein FtsB
MSDLDQLIIVKLEKVETDVSDIKIDVAKNTDSLTHHIKRTNDLQVIVEDLHELVSPLHDEFISKKAIEEYKKIRREEMLYRLKIPGYILAAITLVGTVLTWLVHK